MTSERWSRIDAILKDALDLAPPQRAAYLQQACAGDPPLLEEVESLLSFDAEAPRLIASAVGSAATQFQTERLGLAAGDPIRPYRVVREIGRGGMGTVYLAERDDRQFHKQVAIKLVTRGMDTAALLDRFRHERQILARLEHPYIARLLDGGSTPDGRPYLVMEYVEGKPITTWCAEHRLGTRERIDLFRKVCAAVQSAHQSLVVHRDLKPGNILVDAEGSPKLLDFGIARLLGPGDAAQPTITTGTRMLTPDYASPEQVRGDAITTSSDVYSLGAILYELVAGARPHRLQNYTTAEIEQVICHDEPLKPSAVSPKPKPGDLDNIVLMALQKEPARRYGSVAEFSQDLHLYLAGLPVRARQDTFLYRSGKFVRRHRAGVGAVVLLVATLAGGVAMSRIQAKRAERRFWQLRKLANSVLFDINDRLEGVPGTTPVREAMVSTVIEYLDGLSREAAGDPTLLWELATAYQRVGDLQGYALRPNLGRWPEALESHRKALLIARQLAARDPGPQNQLLLARAWQRTGYLMRSLGDNPGGREHLQHALELAEKLDASRPGDAEYSELLMRINADLGDLERIAGDAAQSVMFNLRPLEIAQRWFAAHPDEVPREAVALGHWRASRALEDTGDFPVALRHAREDIAIMEDLVASRPANRYYRRHLMNGYEQLATVLSHGDDLNLEDRAAARVQYQKVLSMAQELSASDPANDLAISDLTIARRNYCTVLVEDHPAAAAEQCRLGLDLMDRFAGGARDLYRADLWAGLGRAQHRLGNLDQSRQFLRRALDLFQVLAARDPQAAQGRRRLLRTYNSMGALLLDMDDPPGALESYRRALAIAQELLNSRPLDLVLRRDSADCYESLGHYFERRDWRQAREWYQKSLDIWTAWPRSAPSTRLDQNRRARTARWVAACDAALRSDRSHDRRE